MPNTSWSFRVWIICLASVLAVCAGCDSGKAGQSATATPEKPVPPKWEVSHATKSASSAAFNYVAVTKDDVWALGQETDPRTEISRSLLLRYRDGKWEPAAFPPAYPKADLLSNVVLAASPAAPDVWLFASFGNKPHAWRWDGSQWQVVPAAISPLAVLALAPDDIWAVDSKGPVLRHWDGRRWTDQKLALQATALSATGPDDVWVAGTAAAKDGRLQPAIMHFDGRSWRATPAPQYRFSKRPVSGDWATLQNIVAVSPDEAWAFGNHSITSASQQEDIVLRWDGSRWADAPKPMHTWASARDGEGGVILPDPGKQRTADGQDRPIGGPALLPGLSGKITAADRAQRFTARELTLDPRTKTVWGVGFVGSDETTTTPFMRGVIVRFNPGRR